MKLSLALIPICFLVACTAEVGPAPAPTPNSSDGAEGITLRVAQPDRLSGTYVDPGTGLTVVFDVARTDDALYMDVRTGAGLQLIHADTTADQYRFTYMNGRLELSVDKTWVAAVRAEGDDGPAAQDPTAAHWVGDRAVLDEMLTVPEVKVLPMLSRALGVRGFTGADFPASLSLHKIARQSADAFGITVPPIDTASSDTSYCSRPTANDCYGMCGNGCSCWSWVCGDCCYHSGCAKHDSWCRNGQWYYCYNITAVIALFGC